MAQPLSLCLKVSAPTRRGDRLRILISTDRCGCKLRHGLALVVGLQPRTSGTDQAVRAGGESCAGRQWCRRPGPDAGRAGAGTRTSLPQWGHIDVPTVPRVVHRVVPAPTHCVPATSRAGTTLRARTSEGHAPDCRHEHHATPTRHGSDRHQQHAARGGVATASARRTS
jgi:hypothetical protein